MYLKQGSANPQIAYKVNAELLVYPDQTMFWQVNINGVKCISQDITLFVGDDHKAKLSQALTETIEWLFTGDDCTKGLG